MTGATSFGIQLHGTFPMGHYPGLAEIVERYEDFHELTVHDIVWWRPVWPILALIAQATERVLVGPDVTHPYLRHPADTAANLAGIDELSGGRAILGVGAGGSFLDRIGIEPQSPREAVRECVELVQRMLARERTDYQGTVFRANPQARFLWEPVRAEVPVFVAALGPKMIASAATWAPEIRPAGIWAPGFLEDVRGRAEKAAEEVGREVRVGCDVWLAMDEDRDAARAMGRRLLAQFLPARQLRPMARFHDTDPDEIAAVGERMAAADVEGAARLISDETLDTFVAAGTPAEIADGLGRLLEARPSTVTFSGRLGPDPAAALHALGRVVLPEVRAALA